MAITEKDFREFMKNLSDWVTGSNDELVAKVRSVGNTIKSANVTFVEVAGTAIQLPNIECNGVIISALKDNTGSIYIGKSDVSNTVFGVELEKKESIKIPVSNLNEIWIDASVNEDGVSYFSI